MKEGRGALRCAFCHDALAVPQAAVRCPSCNTAVHADCRYRLTRCPTLGCGRRPRQFRRWGGGAPAMLRSRREADRYDEKLAVFVLGSAVAVPVFVLGLWLALAHEQPIQPRAVAADHRVEIEQEIQVAINCMKTSDEPWQRAEEISHYRSLAVPQLMKALEEEQDAETRHQLVYALQEIAFVSRIVDPQLPHSMATLIDRDPVDVRGCAINVLAAVGEPAISALTSSVVADPDTTTRLRAARALADLPPQDVPQGRLISALGREVDVRVRAQIALILSRPDGRKNPAVVDALGRCSRRDPNPFVRCLARVANVRRGGVRLSLGEENHLAWVLAQPRHDEHLRRLARAGRALHPRPLKVDEALYETLASEHPQKRQWILQELQQQPFLNRHLDDPTVVTNRIERLRTDPAPWVALEAMRLTDALGRTHSTSTRNISISCYGPRREPSPEEIARWEARSVEQWVVVLQGGYPDQRKLASRALAHLVPTGDRPSVLGLTVCEPKEGGVVLMGTHYDVRHAKRPFYLWDLKPYDVVERVELAQGVFQVGSAFELELALTRLRAQRANGVWAGAVEVIRAGKLVRVGAGLD